MTSTDVVTPAISDLLVPRPYRVLEKIEEAFDIWSLHLVPVTGQLPAFEPAQVSMLGAFGVGEAAISISSSLSTTDFHAYTIRRAGPITGALVDTPVGGVVTVRGPFGVPWPLEQVATGQLVIIGGGLGIAPLRAVIHEAVGQADRFDRLALLYGAKTPEDLVYLEDIEQWGRTGAEVALIVDSASSDSGSSDRGSSDRGGSDKGKPAWTGPVGVVPDLLDTDAGVHLDWSDTSAFVCGPDVMMHFTAQKLIGLGVDPTQIWLTLERNMQCGNALCGHCQLGPLIVCRDGPVVNYADVEPFHDVPEL